MPIAYTYDAARGLLKAVVTGHITPADVGDFFAKLQVEHWFPVPSLIDVREVSPDVSGEEVREIAKLFHPFGTTLRSTPIAVVVSSDVVFGLVRMIGLLLDNVATIHPFRDVERATNWLAPHLASASLKAVQESK